MDGFPELEQFLLNWPGFDISGYLDFIETGSEPVVLWKKDSPERFTITDTHSSADLLQQGIWLENRSVLIGWDTFNALENNSLIKTISAISANERYAGRRYLNIEPVIFNGLRLKELECTTGWYDKEKGVNYDLPVTWFSGMVPLGNQPEKGFRELRSHLKRYLKGWEIAETKSNYIACTFTKERINIQIRCFYSEELKAYNELCWLEINYEPILSRFFTNDYQLNLQLDDAVTYLLLPIKAALNQVYRLDPGDELYISYTPVCLKTVFTEQPGFLIWKDTKVGKVGFAGQDTAMIFDSNLVLFCEYFRNSLSRVILKLKIKGKDHPQLIAEISYATIEDLNLAMSKIEKLLGVRIERIEDHQSY